MRPFFPYYGSKWRGVRLYPAPQHPRIVEPFAGSASYSTWHAPKEALLVDADEYVCGVWSYLIKVKPSELLALPDLRVGEDVHDVVQLQEARWLIGYWLNMCSSAPRRTMSPFATKWSEYSKNVWGPKVRARLASQVERIRGWSIMQGSYRMLNVVGSETWFVDPPYIDKGRHYRHRLAAADYQQLAIWAHGLPGQVMVCEQAGADWMPFGPLADLRGVSGVSREVIWTTNRSRT